MQPVRLGIIGLGNMGAVHARSIAAIPEATLVAVADQNLALARTIAGETGVRAFPDAKALLESGEVEAVLVATPHFSHPDITFQAANKGVHVLCEKPLTVSVSAANTMVSACERAGVLLGVMFQQRTSPARTELKKMIERGELGSLHRINMVAPWYRTQAYYDSGSWRGTWQGEGGGILMNQAPHSLDQFVWLFGRSPQFVQAICDTRLHTIEVENLAVAICDYGDGVTGQFYASTSDIPTGECVEIAGDRGLVCLDERGLRFFELETPLSDHLKTAKGGFDAPAGAWRTIATGGDEQSHPAVIAAFARAVRAGDASLLVADGRAGRAALELANAILLAGYTRREVALPLDSAAFDDMLSQLQAGTAPRELRAHAG